MISSSCPSIHLHARELRKRVEVGIPIVQRERMLEYQGCNPHVVNGNRCSLFS